MGAPSREPRVMGKMLESLAEGSVGADDQEVLYTQDQVNEILKDAMADKKAAIRDKLNTQIGGENGQGENDSQNS